MKSFDSFSFLLWGEFSLCPHPQTSMCEIMSSSDARYEAENNEINNNNNKK